MSRVHGPTTLGPCRKSPTPQSAGEGPAALRGLLQGKNLVVSHPTSRPCYTQARIPRKGPPVGTPEDPWVLVTPAPPAVVGPEAFPREPPWGAGLRGVQAQQGEAGTAGASGSTQPVVSRSRFAPGRHQHSVDTWATWSLSKHPAPGRPGTNLAAGPVFSFTWSSPSFQVSLKSEVAGHT